MSVKVEDMIHVMRDVLLLENQVPFLLLELLWRNTNRYSLIQTMAWFYGIWCPIEEVFHYLFENIRIPPHLLDLQRSIILHQHNVPVATDTNQTQHDPNDVLVVRYRNISELKAAGIGLKKGKTRNPGGISFSNGWFYSELMLPEIVVNEITVDLMFNLTAYERCHDFENDYGICSYYSFLDSLVDHPDDVKELKLQGILLNSLRSNEEVANFFNTIGTTLVPEKGKYGHIRAQIERHYSHKSLPTWLALGYHTYFSNPWTIIAFLAAILGLVLTFIQTWYAIHPPK
ncbi:UPF0481 protein [Spatholobus suberectus]|nr:UPF0481 protein [Spatholobus suberectus]